MNENVTIHAFADIPLITEFPSSKRHHKKKKQTSTQKYSKRLFFISKFNLGQLESDIEAAHLDFNTRLSCLNYISSTVALEEQEFNFRQLGENYDAQINKAKLRAEEEIINAKKFYAEKMIEYKEKLDKLKPKAEIYEKKADRYAEKEKFYFQKAAEYELYQESLKLKAELEQLNKENGSLLKEYEKYRKAKIKYDARKLEKQKLLKNHNKLNNRPLVHKRPTI